MKRLSLLPLLVMTLLITSCTTLKKTAATVDVNASITQYPTLADLEIKGKVEKTVVWNWNPFRRDITLNVRKGNLIAEILKEADADVLLEPQTIYTKQSFGERTLTVIGIPAKYKNFRKATEKDLKVLEAVSSFNEKTEYNSLKGLFK